MLRFRAPGEYGSPPIAQPLRTGPMPCWNVAYAVGTLCRISVSRARWRWALRVVAQPSWW